MREVIGVTVSALLVCGLVGVAAPVAGADVSRSVTDATVTDTRSGTTPSDGKARACMRAEAKVGQLGKRVDRLEGRDAPAKKIRKAKKALGKWENRVEARCDVDGGVTEKWTAQQFSQNTPMQDASAKEIAAYQQAIRNVSGENWTDQSHLPPDERVGYPPSMPAPLREALINESNTGRFAYANAQVGDVIAERSTVIEAPAYRVSEDGANVMMVYKVDNIYNGVEQRMVVTDAHGGVASASIDSDSRRAADDYQLLPGGGAGLISAGGEVYVSFGT